MEKRTWIAITLCLFDRTSLDPVAGLLFGIISTKILDTNTKYWYINNKKGDGKEHISDIRRTFLANNPKKY